MTATSNLG